MKPNFLVIGAARSGSTSLFHYLSAHSQVFMPPTKELHFFDLRYEEGSSWYRGQFCAASTHIAVGEASPSYMYDQEATRRMGHDLPDARLVAILRNPVERAYSQYWQNRARRREPLSFAEAIEAEAARLRSPDKRTRLLYSYVDQGWYLDQLEGVCRWFPRDRLLVLLLDDMRSDPARMFRVLARFLGIDPTDVPAVVGRRVNEHRTFRSLWLRNATRTVPKPVADAIGRMNSRAVDYPPMPTEVRTRVTEQFSEANQALARWLGRDLSNWNDIISSQPESRWPER